MLLINHDLLPSQVLAPAVVPARLVGPFTGAADCGQAGQLSCRHPRTQPAAGGHLICPFRVPAVALARSPKEPGSPRLWVPRSHGSDRRSQVNKILINVRLIYEPLPYGMWTTSAFFLYTGRR